MLLLLLPSAQQFLAPLTNENPCANNEVDFITHECISWLNVQSSQTD